MRQSVRRTLMTPPLFVNVVNLDVPLVHQPTTLLTLPCTETHLCPPLPHSSTLTLILPILHLNKLLASNAREHHTCFLSTSCINVQYHFQPGFTNSITKLTCVFHICFACHSTN